MGKRKLSVTIDASVAEELDRVAAGRTRSDVVEEALVAWLGGARERRLEAEIEAYYASLGPEEKAEDAEWAEAAGKAAADSWT